MIDLYFWPTENGKKVIILLEECGMPYTVKPLNIHRGAQFKPDYLKIAPNNRMPALVDHDPVGGGGPVTIFESGAIMMYIAEKAGRFWPQEIHKRYEVVQWVMWQMSALGPMLGQHSHFMRRFQENDPAKGDLHYPVERFLNEGHRLFGVMNLGLFRKRYFAAGEYTIADMIIYPWANTWKKHGVDINEFPNVKAWWEEIGSRPVIQKAMAIGPEYVQSSETISTEERALRSTFMHGQRALPIPKEWLD